MNVLNAWNAIPLLLAQQPEFAPPGDDGAGAAGAAAAMGGLCVMFVYFLLIVLMIAGLWTTFAKAGRPGWAAIIPIYNMFVLTEVARKEILWFVLTLVPCINIVALILISIDVAKNFGKGTGFGLGLAFLPFIFYPMLGFGGARYQGVAGLKTT